MHFLSEPALWISHSEFVDPQGKISVGRGETRIQIKGSVLYNESFVNLAGKHIENHYLIRPGRSNVYHF